MEGYFCYATQAHISYSIVILGKEPLINTITLPAKCSTILDASSASIATLFHIMKWIASKKIYADTRTTTSFMIERLYNLVNRRKNIRNIHPVSPPKRQIF